jgi:hypothetical protein
VGIAITILLVLAPLLLLLIFLLQVGIMVQAQRYRSAQMDDTQSIIDQIVAEEAEVDALKETIGQEFQTLKDQIANQPGPNVNKQLVLDELNKLHERLGTVDPGAASSTGGGTGGTDTGGSTPPTGRRA